MKRRFITTLGVISLAAMCAFVSSPVGSQNRKRAKGAVDVEPEPLATADAG